MVHMGGDIRNLSTPSAPIFRVQGALLVPATGPVSRHLRLDMDQVFKGAESKVDLSDFPLAFGSGGRRRGEPATHGP